MIKFKPKRMLIANIVNPYNDFRITMRVSQEILRKSTPSDFGRKLDLQPKQRDMNLFIFCITVVI